MLQCYCAAIDFEFLLSLSRLHQQQSSSCSTYEPVEKEWHTSATTARHSHRIQDKTEILTCAERNWCDKAMKRYGGCLCCGAYVLWWKDQIQASPKPWASLDWSYISLTGYMYCRPGKIMSMAGTKTILHASWKTLYLSWPIWLTYRPSDVCLHCTGIVESLKAFPLRHNMG